jgi:pimeloyl-ACP methyl ester carboxylesterase
MATLKRIRTATLDIAYAESGPADGTPVMLMHGWPYDVHDYDEVAPVLAGAGCRAIVPYLRGFGPTHFLAAATPRSGEQAALGNDLKELMDALGIENAALAGYDWGGRAACVVAALWPERARCLVTGNGYNIQDIASSAEPAAPEQEYRYWYQYYFHSERGRMGLTKNRRALIKLLWRLWSPHRRFSNAEFAASASAFDNPDFVDVTIQSYRHRYGYAPGDPALEEIERWLAAQPNITVPTIALQGEADGVGPPGSYDSHDGKFTGRYERRLLPRIGHNPPREAPRDFAAALLELIGATNS